MPDKIKQLVKWITADGISRQNLKRNMLEYYIRANIEDSQTFEANWVSHFPLGLPSESLDAEEVAKLFYESSRRLVLEGLESSMDEQIGSGFYQMLDEQMKEKGIVPVKEQKPQVTNKVVPAPKISKDNPIFQDYPLDDRSDIESFSMDVTEKHLQEYINWRNHQIRSKLSDYLNKHCRQYLDLQASLLHDLEQANEDDDNYSELSNGLNLVNTYLSDQINQQVKKIREERDV